MTEAVPDWWTRAVADFGAGMGLAGAGEWQAGGPQPEVLNLSVDGGAYLIDVERSGDEIVLAVLRRAAPAEFEEKALALLGVAGVERYHPFALQVGLKGDDVLVLAARLARNEAHRMPEAFDLVRGLYAQAGL